MSNHIQTPPTADNAPQAAMPQDHGNTKGDAELSKEEKKFLIEKDIAEMLRDQIDKRGNYGKRLTDFALGYAAAHEGNVTVKDARDNIKAVFEKHMGGVEIQRYLENDRIAKGKSVDRER